MTTADGSFHTGVAGASGVWPQPPSMWSYSSLKEAEECPRRWMLSRASYPDVWSGRGYPPRPTAAALLGDVVHAVLETILRGFTAAGCLSIKDPSTVDVLKGFGGYSKLAERAIDVRLGLLSGNPRVAERVDGLRTALVARLPEIRQRIQEIISRVQLLPAPAETNNPSDADKQRIALNHGSHPEVMLQSAELRLRGRVDLITVASEACEIVDYKTGVEALHHHDQLRLYALLWSLDVDLNPMRRRATRLVVAYATHDVVIDAPASDELAGLKDHVRSRVQQAELSLTARPPSARPSAEWCQLCSVRHLCSDYWQSPVSSKVDIAEGARFDFEGSVQARNGPRSWVLSSKHGQGNLLLRAASEATSFDIGDDVRILNLVRTDDPESSLLIGTMTQGSEIFLLDGART